MPILIITANPALSSPVDIDDIGVTLAPGESITYSEQEDLESAQESEDVLTLATDAAFSTTSTLILSDGVSVISQSTAANFLITSQWPVEGPYGLVRRDENGDADFSINPTEHREIYSLVHESIRNSYQVVTYVQRQPVLIVEYTDITMSQKIRETQIVYAQRQPVEVTSIQFDSSGLETERTVETITYVQRQVSTVTKVLTVS